MKKTELILLVFVLMIFSCKKEDFPCNNLSDVQLGNYKNMICANYDTIIQGSYNSPRSITLDFNHDGVDDLQLKSEIWGSPGMGQHPQLSVQCLNDNCLIKGTLQNDTTFYSYLENTYIDSINGPLNIQYYQTYSFLRINKDDSIYSITKNVFHVDYMNENDFLEKEDEFRSDTFVVTSGISVSVNGPYPGVTNDTLKYYFETHYRDGNVIPNNRFSYIGIKLIKDGKEKLGWIKLNVVNSYILVFLESAVQE